ncbi:orotidine-5'-phosphate decarboxylase [Nesterenkonia sp.]|uniref:orotidine-5'-phosphate decarboxylase n=1 Tax=Nesterenkonia sp. TaxID=704201 RepID=UPI0026023C02|nr:orotidine-5'-phosphate decarboxylase [Nesterenkonia sp.]
MTRQSFGTRLAAALGEKGPLCVGLDPHPEILSDWGLSPDAAGLREFGQRVIEAASGRVGVIKPQVAFYEAHGPAGMQALTETISYARHAGLLVIADAKRGDIGSTMTAYAEAWLNPERDFAADALTVSPYLGFGSLQPAVEAAERHQAGLFVLTLTSNPEGQDVQLARLQHHVAQVARAHRTVAGQVAAEAARRNTAASAAPLGHIGLVVGATTAHLAVQHQIDLTAGSPPLLAPGYGAQGADAQQLRRSFGRVWDQVVVNSSRGILTAGPEVADLRAAIESSRADLG